MSTYDDTIAEAISHTNTTPVGVATILAETLNHVDLLLPNQAYPVSAGDTATFTNTLIVSWGALLAERISTSPAVLANWTLHGSLSDTVSLVDSPAVSWLMTLSETITTTNALTVLQGLTILEMLEITPAAVGNTIANLSVLEGLVFTDALSLFIGCDVSETFSITSALLGSTLAAVTVGETVTISEALAPSLILRVTAAETLDLTDTQALQMLYVPQIDETIEISALYLSPGGGFTTWVMNTRTAGVTEYQNYEFNSFARIGNKYVGATEDGLYELDGDTDAGEDIIATLRSGLAQFAGAHLSRFRGIYLAVRGEGDFILRVITGEGVTYNYAVAARSMRSTKVHVGKGLQARYWRFELVSTGQDFDFESLEFVPLVKQRRV